MNANATRIIRLHGESDLDSLIRQTERILAPLTKRTAALQRIRSELASARKVTNRDGKKNEVPS